MATLVGFKPRALEECEPSVMPTAQQQHTPSNPFQRSSSGRSQPARSLLSELLFAAVTAEQQQAAEQGGQMMMDQAAAQMMQQGQGGDCWMDDDCCSDDEDSEDEEGSEDEEVAEGAMADMLIDVLPQARSSPLPIPPPA